MCDIDRARELSDLRLLDEQDEEPIDYADKADREYDMWLDSELNGG